MDSGSGLGWCSFYWVVQEIFRLQFGVSNLENNFVVIQKLIWNGLEDWIKMIPILVWNEPILVWIHSRRLEWFRSKFVSSVSIWDCLFLFFFEKQTKILAGVMQRLSLSRGKPLFGCFFEIDLDVIWLLYSTY